MRFPASFTASLAVAALVVCAGVRVSAQESSSQSQVPPPADTTPQPAYIAIDPLAGVRYDNKWEMSVELAYRHIKAGPNLLQGANLGGPTFNASYRLARRWRLEGTFRPSLGTSGAAPNAAGIQGPFIAEYMFAAGPEWLGPHNKHGAITAHVLAGGTYGDFEHDLGAYHATAETVGFYNNQIAFATIMGGHFDLNRSARWVIRMSPDAVWTHYGINYGTKAKQWDVNAAFSVGVEYRFLPKTKK
ncbi:MAG TPA: hypothetical protein VGL22_21090 [Terracidiphilus sp.]|jgi:hypothetical protein